MEADKSQVLQVSRQAGAQERQQCTCIERQQAQDLGRAVVSQSEGRDKVDIPL